MVVVGAVVEVVDRATVVDDVGTVAGLVVAGRGGPELVGDRGGFVSGTAGTYRTVDAG